MVKNYAIIDDLDISFEPGMTVITGETGAGKSVLMSAVMVVLGGRVDAKVLSKSSRTVVEAEFSVQENRWSDFDDFISEDDDFKGAFILRREVGSEGKSRCFLNDTPIKIASLKKIVPSLLNVYSQNEAFNLTTEDYGVQILDAYAVNEDEVARYKQHLLQYNKVKAALLELKSQQDELQKRRDYEEYLLEELKSAQLKSGEQSSLEKERKLLGSADEVKRELSILLDSLQGDKDVVSTLSSLSLGVEKLGSSHLELQQMAQRVRSISIDLADVASELRGFLETLEFDPVRLEEVEERLALIYELERKHNVGTDEALISFLGELEQRHLHSAGIDGKVLHLDTSLGSLKKELDDIALRIYRARIGVVDAIVTKLKTLLQSLGMPDADFRVDVTPTDRYLKDGRDEVSFFFSANKGRDLQPLYDVVSGGEASRIMLALKYILASKCLFSTVILDEIDAGVSGSIAHKMGETMLRMSQQSQVIVITHLPQVAVKGRVHYRVTKRDVDGRAVSKLVALSGEDRLIEIAQMLSNSSEVSQTAIRQAGELMGEHTS